MSNLGVSGSDFANGPLDNGAVFGGSDEVSQSLAQLSKALEAGSLTGRDTTNLNTVGAQGLKAESLDKNLKLITFQESDIVLWKRIPKAPAYNTVEEFMQQTSYGADRGGFLVEGETPENEDSVYVRNAQLVKFLGVTKSVTHAATLTQSNFGNLLQRQITDGTLWILRKVNRALTVGNSQNIPEEFDGLYVQHAMESNTASPQTETQYLNSNVVVDLRGLPLVEANIETAAEAIVENFGYGSLLMAPPRVLTDFVKNFYGNKFIPVNGTGITDGKMGQRVTSFASQYGDIDLKYDKFMNPAPPRSSTSAATHPSKAPNAVTGLTATAVVDATNKFGTTGPAFYWGVAAENRFGESTVTTIASTTTVTSGDSVDLAFTDGGGSYPATCYVIYRSLPNPVTAQALTTLYPIFKVSVAKKVAGYGGATAGKVRDINNYLPNTYSAFLIQDNDEVYAFKQLAPLMKMDLAQLGPAYRFMVLLYGATFLFAPLKMVKFINIGKAAI